MDYITAKELAYSKIRPVDVGYPGQKPKLKKSVFEMRLQKLVAAIKEHDWDAVAIYGDREHYYNIKYFTDFGPRFEEALLVIHSDGKMACALGNECIGLAKQSIQEIEPVLCSLFSLPNQPMESFVSGRQTLEDCGIKAGMKIGVIDWKLISVVPDKSASFFPVYLFEALVELVGSRHLIENATGILIDPKDGIRIIQNEDEIAELEYGACIASQAVKDIMNTLTPGMSESGVSLVARTFGQPLSTHPTIKGGVNARKSMISPTDNILQLGDEVSFSFGLEGGLSCRRAYLTSDGENIGVDPDEYIEEYVKPYMATVFNWYQMMEIGTEFGELYKMVEETLPKEKFKWALNPGHYIGYEEWMSSPFFRDSKIKVTSGMVIQMDIIPHNARFSTPKCEDGLSG